MRVYPQNVMHSSKTVFEQIWSGDLPSFPIFKSDKHGIQVVLDIFPAQPGHMLVIPREPVDHIFDLEPHRYLQVFTVSQAAAQQIRDVLEPLRVMHIVSGYDIPHVHVHLLPSFRRGDTESKLLAGREGKRATDEDLAAMQTRLVFPKGLAEELEMRMDRIMVQETGFSQGVEAQDLVRRLHNQ
jgi:histidine triad (HIT) family protein